jgi:hypothetical protein
MASVDFPMSDAVSGMTLQLRITGQTRFRIRLWLGCQIIRLAASVIGCKSEVELEMRSDAA